MKIILDAMGGDHAPEAPVLGALQAAKDFGAQIILVGKGEEIQQAMHQQGIDTLPDGVENPPVMICLQGHSTGMHISLGRPVYPGDVEMVSGGDRDFGLEILKEGYAALVLEAE